MSDVYVYHFYPLETGGARSYRSMFAATLAAIEKMGHPIMESQLVVDASEVNAEGVLGPAVGFGSSRIMRLSASIKSLELRAEARNLQAISMNANSDGAAIYMLSLESSHLRQEAKKLAIQRAEALEEESSPPKPGLAVWARRSPLTD
jgi:hypothetical protein